LGPTTYFATVESNNFKVSTRIGFGDWLVKNNTAYERIEVAAGYEDL